MVSAVILAYNRCAEVLFTIAKLKEYSKTLPFSIEIVVVDNASADNTTLQIKQTHADVVVVTKKVNNAIAGWNDGFEVAKHKYFLVLDDDSHIESGLQESIEYLEKNPNVGALALNVTTGPYLSRGRWLDGQDTYGFYGCGGIIRKEVYKKIGGFAEWIKVYAHEWDYGLRILDAGYKIKYFENSNIIHRASGVNRSLKRFWIYSTRNEMSIVYKYFGSNNRWKVILNMAGNNFKPLKVGDYKRAYNCVIGFLKFFSWRKTLEHTPARQEVQVFFERNHLNTYPVFGFVSRKIKHILRNK